MRESARDRARISILVIPGNECKAGIRQEKGDGNNNNGLGVDKLRPCHLLVRFRPVCHLPMLDPFRPPPNLLLTGLFPTLDRHILLDKDISCDIKVVRAPKP